MIHTLAIKRSFESIYSGHFGMTPIQKATELINLFGKERAIIYCNEKIDFFDNSFNDKLIDRFNYWKEVKTKIK